MNRPAFPVVAILLTAWIVAAAGALATLDDARIPAPFQTSAEMYGYYNDRCGVVSHGAAGAQLVYFSHPDIQDVLVNGSALTASARYKDLIRVYLPQGPQEVTIRTAGNGPTAAYTPTAAIDTASAFNSAAAALSPGGELVVRNGYYRNWSMTIPDNVDGTPANPILIRPETPGGVTFGFGCDLFVRGDYIVFKGFRFDQAGHDRPVINVYASHSRITQCHFFHCGRTLSTFTHICELENDADYNRVDHCFWTGSKSMSLALNGSSDASKFGVRNRFDHNIFRDIYRFSYNGQENIQLGQGHESGQDADATPAHTIEYNLFDNAWGDVETCSIKCSSNTLRYNVAANNRSAFTLRSSENTLVESNISINCQGGVRTFRKGNKIVNNLFMNLSQEGVYFYHNDTTGPCSQTLVANNTFIDAGQIALRFQPGEPERMRDNEIRNNIVMASRGYLIDPDVAASATNTTIDHNLLWAVDGAATGPTGANAILQNPRLEGVGAYMRPGPNSPAINAATTLAAAWRDRWAAPRPVGATPDIGAEEIGGDGTVALPDIPDPRPPFPFDAYKGRILAMYNLLNPDDGWTTAGAVDVSADALQLATEAQIQLARSLPKNFVMEWEYRPDTFPAKTTLLFSEETSGDAYQLEFGGSAYNDKPSGVITLRKANQGIVAQTADLQYHWMNYSALSGDPSPTKWYKLRLIKLDGMIRLEMNCEKIQQEIIPCMAWKDTAQIGGTVLNGPALRIEQTGGTAFLRKLCLWDCAPAASVAIQPAGAPCIAWEAENASAVLNPDAEDDIQNSAATGTPENPEQVWTVVTDRAANAGAALQAPPSPHKQQTDTSLQESVAEYRLLFAEPGDYYLYFRAKNNGIPGNGGSDSFWRAANFTEENPSVNVGVNNSGNYTWAQSGVYTVAPGDLGKILKLRIGVRENQAQIDTFVLITTNSLSSAALDILCQSHIPQQDGVDYVAFQAEEASEIQNPDEANDVQANVQQGYQEFPVRTWTPTDCDDALACSMLKAPAAPHRQQAAPPIPHESVAVYRIAFLNPGTYKAYLRVRNNGVPGNQSSDSLWIGSDFDTTPTVIAYTGSTGLFDWVSRTGYTVGCDKIGIPIEFRIGVRESEASVDAIVFSKNTALTDAQLDALATACIDQPAGANYVAFEAEKPSAIMNPDAANDVQASLQTGLAEYPAQIWTAVTDAAALGAAALKSPPSPHSQSLYPQYPETIAVYSIRFATAGTYTAYFRARNDGTPGGGGSDSFYRAADFATAIPATNVGIPNSDGAYHWVKSGAYTVAAGDLNNILHLRIAARESNAHIDAIVLSTNAALDDATLDACLNHPPAFFENTLTRPHIQHIQTITGTLIDEAWDPDPADILTFSKTDGPDWLDVAGDGALSGAPDMTDVGINQFTVRATDRRGASAEATLQIEVTCAYPLNQQGQADDYIAWQAENTGLVLNPDADNDVQYDARTGSPESPAQAWTTVSDDNALDTQAVKAPPYPHKQQTDTSLQESILVYYHRFAADGTYTAYFRCRNSGVPNDKGSDSFWRQSAFGDANPSLAVGTPSTGSYDWVKSGAYTVGASDVGKILEMRIGVRESNAHIDAIVLSADNALTDAELDDLFD